MLASKDCAYAYDLDGAVTSVDNAGTPGGPNVVLSLTYVNGRREALTDSLGGEVFYTYDFAGRLEFLDYNDSVSEAELSFQFTYDGLSRLTDVLRTDWEESFELTTSYAYDVASRVTNITHEFDGTQLSSFTYSYTADGQLLTYTGPEGTLNYTYDDTKQLIGVSGDRTENYDFDANGNRTMTGYQTGANNRLLSDGTHTWQYDAEGNRILETNTVTGETREYEWDHRNRLTRVVIKDSGGAVIREARFTYDVFDRLILRWVDPDGAGVASAEKLFTVYDGEHAYMDFVWNDSTGQFDVAARYLYRDAIDQIMARIAADGTIDYYLTDRLGTVRQNVATDGTILNENTFDSFGQTPHPD